MATPRQLRRSASRVFGGVCGGLAEYFGIDPTVVRIIWIALTILSMGFGGVILYLLAWVIMPGPFAGETQVSSPAPAGKAMVGAVLIAIGIILIMMMALPWRFCSPWHWHWFWHWPFAMMRFALPVILLIVGVVLIVLGIGSRSSMSTTDVPPPPESGAPHSDSAESERPPARRLYRSIRNRKIAGICGGLGDYFNVDPTLLRVLWIVLVIFFFTGILLYLILWIVVPQEPIVIPPTTPSS